jgi:hypothetical protein
MKKTAACLILFLLALLAWAMYAINLGGDPLAPLLGMLFGGGGILIALFVLMLVGVVLTLVFAGVGIVLLGALVLAGLVLAATLAPLLLPLLLPLAVIWYLARRAPRQQRA